MARPTRVIGCLPDQHDVVVAPGAAWADHGVVTASLDHAMWWHNDGRVDDWIALVQDSPAAGGGLALTRASIFSHDGVLLASVGQQGLVQLP
jgi:acyl-CoA thioesterase-2